MTRQKETREMTSRSLWRKLWHTLDRLFSTTNLLYVSRHLLGFDDYRVFSGPLMTRTEKNKRKMLYCVVARLVCCINELINHTEYLHLAFWGGWDLVWSIVGIA